MTTDGHYVVTFVSTTASTAADEEATRRIFYGSPARMEEALPGRVDYSCARYMSFDLEGTPYTATLAGPLCGVSVPSRLDIGAGTSHAVLPLSVLVGGGQPVGAAVLVVPAVPAVPVDTFSYVCF